MPQENVFQYLERHVSNLNVYHCIGYIVGQPNITAECDGFGQAFLLGDNRIVDARGRPVHGALVRVWHAVTRISGIPWMDEDQMDMSPYHPQED